jgi:hypothetical protein
MASALSIVFLVLGIACQFLLTRQQFTAAIQGITCLTISLALCIYLERRTRDDESEQTQNRIVGIIAAVMILVNVLQLPRRYEDEKDYQRILDNARAIESREANLQLQRK